MRSIAPLIIENSPDAFCVTDENALILYVNPAFSKITQYSLDDVLGKNPNVLSSGRQNTDFYASLWSALDSDGYWEGEIWNKRKNKQIYPEWLRITALKEKSGRVTNYVSQFTDITSQKQNEHKMLHLAYYDGVTDLPNRKLLMERLQYALANASRYHHKLALFFVDLDHFKDINDSYGHDVGDAVLKEMASRLESCKRAGDTVARLGGDEFVWLSPEVYEIKEIEGCAARIKDIFGKPFIVNKHAFKVTASVGISLYPDHGNCVEELLKSADSAMYRAKKMGRDRSVLFDTSMLTSFDSYQLLADAFCCALKKGEVQLKLLPRYEVNSVDDILRDKKRLFSHSVWDDQGFVLDQPELFRLAKEQGCSQVLNRWIIERATSKWHEENRQSGNTLIKNEGILLSMVLSSDQMNSINASWTAFLSDQVSRAGLKAEQVELVFQEDLLSNDQAVSSITSSGYKIGITDFCHNVSPLISLSRSSVKSVYLAHVWIANAINYEFHRKVLVAMVDIAQSLNLDVVIDSDLSDSEVDMARSLGIQYLNHLC